MHKYRINVNIIFCFEYKLFLAVYQCIDIFQNAFLVYLLAIKWNLIIHKVYVIFNYYIVYGFKRGIPLSIMMQTVL